MSLWIEHGVHANQVTAWKRQLLDGAAGVFESPVDKRVDGGAVIKDLHAKIGELMVERVLLSRALKR